MVLVYTDVWSFLYVTTTLVTPHTFNKFDCIHITSVTYRETSPTIYTMGNEKMCQDVYQLFPSLALQFLPQHVNFIKNETQQPKHEHLILYE